MACSGYVKSIKQNWLTAVRQIEYLISQEIHKEAQAYINAQYVIPGCAAAFRTKIFKKHITFDHDTLTEDLDFTYKHHRNNFKIKYSKKAIVYTQDPATLPDYICQLRRWHGGNWQNLLKHRQIFEKPANAFELSLIYLEGLVFPILILFALITNFKVFLLFALSYFIIILGFAIFGAIRDRRLDLILFAPIFFFVSFINYAIFIEQLIKEVVLQKKNLVWFQPERITQT
jgi:biofilm PGA synthesis N-glycosyltransferase PgaC